MLSRLLDINFMSSFVIMDDERLISETELQNVFYSSSYYLAAKSILFSDISISRKTPSHVNYQDELTIYFFNEMLPYIVEDWRTIERYPEPLDDEFRPEESLMKQNEMDISDIKEEEKSVGELSLEKNDEKRRSRHKKSISFSSPSSKTSSIMKSIKKGSNLSMIKESLKEEEIKQVPIEVKEVKYDEIYDWMVKDLDEFSEVTFKNGCVYRGPVRRKMLEGQGILRWPDGAYYEGEFSNGMINGVGTFYFTEYSYYSGHFCNGWMHGFGSFYPNALQMIYNGNWKGGKKHGKGWLYYEPNNYYDGEWYEDKKQGHGFRQYLNNTVYNGDWYNGKIHGSGICYFSNSDFYKGEWVNGVPDGYGSYTWNASVDKGISIPLSNMYEGTWKEGKREGLGVMYLGTESAKLASIFKQDMKDGPGIFICGNGTILNRNPLFVEDSPNTFSMDNTNSTVDETSDVSNQKRRSLQVPSSHRSSKMDKIFMSHQKKFMSTYIPIHENAIDIDLSFHVNKIVTDYYNLTSDPEDITLPASMWNLLQSKESLENYVPRDFVQLHMDFHYEENKLRKSIMFNYDKLFELYKQYSSITSNNLNHKSILSRMFLWQMYRDLEIHKFGYSLIDADNMLLEIEGCAVETNHYPFELIYFWQFLHSFLSIIYGIYASGEYFEEYKETGAYSQMVEDFLRDNVFPKQGRFVGQCLFKYKDLLPIEAVYELYKTLGEPHTVRTFLIHCCVQKGWEIPCYLKDKEPDRPVKVINGFNAVATGSNFIYLPEEPPDIGEPPKKNCDYPIDKDAFYKDLKVFRTLGVNNIIECITRVCPLIEKDGFIININYELTFLEFYEILIICGQELIKHYKLQKREAEEKELLRQTLADIRNESVVKKSKEKKHRK